jgi:hypothetical protein
MTDRPEWERRAIDAIAKAMAETYNPPIPLGFIAPMAVAGFDALGVRSRGCHDAGEPLFSIDATRDNPEKAFEETGS